MSAWTKILTELRETDVWIGKNIFHPQVIFLCRLLNSTQHRLQMDLWFLGFMGSICFQLSISKEPVSWFDWLILTILFLAAILISPQKRGASYLWLRIFLLVSAFSKTLEVIISVYKDTLDYSYIVNLVINIMFLIAEYATTIDTIPPLGSSKRKEVYRESFS